MLLISANGCINRQLDIHWRSRRHHFIESTVYMYSSRYSRYSIACGKQGHREVAPREFDVHPRWKLEREAEKQRRRRRRRRKKKDTVNFCEQKCARAGPNRDTFKPDFMSGWQVDQRRACNLLMMFIYLKYYFHSFMMSWVSLWKTALSNPFVSEVRAARTVTSKWLKCAQVWPLFQHLQDFSTTGSH